MRSICLVAFLQVFLSSILPAADRPNILIAISDDQSFPHTSAYGCTFVNTPAFDRVAHEGVLFTNGFAASPGCSPSRAAFLTGQNTWQIEHAGTHDSYFPAQYRTFPEILKDHGYHVGMTGKGWGPGDYKHDGREDNPAGKAYSSKKLKPPYSGMNKLDYAGNFKEFLNEKSADQPFCFWYGATEPHRPYQDGEGLKDGKSLDQVIVPNFLPDDPIVRRDLLDYAVEIEWFDKHLGQMLDHLEKSGQLDNTIVIVTADNGMSFPRAKANCYEAGIHVPLAICWKSAAPGNRVVTDLVGFTDLTATLYDATSIQPPQPLSGKSILPLLKSDKSGLIEPGRDAVFSARERHSSSRYNNLGYPQRAMRTHDYLLIWNCTPDRWPAGDPRGLNNDGSLAPEHSAYFDIDHCPTLSLMTDHPDDPHLSHFLNLAIAKRPEYELFNIKTDPSCLTNLADDPAHQKTFEALKSKLNQTLTSTSDPRILGTGEIFETYPRMSKVRRFPGDD